jgi:fido (protein-threonine AMPylation protein)
MNMVDHISEFDRRSQEQADWRNMQPRLLPGVDSLSEYRIRSSLGLAEAQIFLEDHGGLNPGAGEITQIHKIAFGECVQDAGRIRKPGECATFGGNLGAEAQRIPLEMERLRVEMSELLAHAGTDLQKCTAIGFYHARFIGIHPFVDGNGRTGRTLMAAQAETSLGASLPLLENIAAHRGDYITAVGDALRHNDLTAMTKIVADGAGISYPEDISIPSPFAIASRRMMSMTDILPMEVERDIARTGAPLPSAEPARAGMSIDR